jgi:hypothetical protein
VVSMLGRGGNEGSLLIVELGSPSKTLVSIRIPVEVKDCGPKTGGSVAEGGEAVKTVDMEACAESMGASVPRGDIVFNIVDSASGSTAEGVGSAADGIDRAPLSKAVVEIAGTTCEAESRDAADEAWAVYV